MKRIDSGKRAFIPLAAALALQGCVLLVGGAAVGGAVVASDRRSAGEQLEDQQIEAGVRSALNDRIPKNAMDIHAISYDRKVVLIGQVRTAAWKEQASQAASHTDKVREVYNELAVGEPESFSDSADDTYVASKVKAALLGAEGVPGGAVLSTVSGGVVYLMGKVTPAEGEAAATAARRVGGVLRVVKLFELVDARQLAEIKKQQAASPNSAKDDIHP